MLEKQVLQSKDFRSETAHDVSNLTERIYTISIEGNGLVSRELLIIAH